ncbi:MAG: N-acetylmuramoyl-L-alanine amidase [Clostridiales bacterium]|nr:N-acetylmuramoyl-L-alanine amidase [Clostridiales bacterium]
MSDSTNNKSENNIPEEEEPLGGLYDEEEKRKLDSAKDFVSDRKDDILDMKDNIDNFKDIIEQMKNREKESSSSSEDSDKSNETTSNDKNSKSEDISSNSTEGLGDKSTTTSNLGNEAGAKTAGAETSGVTTTGGATSAGAGTGGAGVAAAAPVIPIIIIAIIVIIFIIGIIGFFTVMPGLILGKLKKFGFQILEGLKGATTGNSKIVTQDEIKGVAQYIQNLGYDIQTYGFADVTYKKKTKKDIEDNNASSTKEINKIVPINKNKNNDYLSAYITADAQTYVSADTFLLGRVVNIWDNLKALVNHDDFKSIDQSSSGLINILNHKIPFINSKDTVDYAEDYAVVNTEKRKLYINTKTFVIAIPILSDINEALNSAIGLVHVKNNSRVVIRRGSSYSFDLESWTAMYGRPLELFIALHTSTMMPDLAQQIATGSDFNTKVNIELLKSKMMYDIEINSKDGKSVKFSHDTDKYSETDEPITNAKQFVDNFLETAIEPEDKGVYKNLVTHVENVYKENPNLEFEFFYEIWKSGEDAKGIFNFGGKLDYKKAADNVLKGEATFEFEDTDNTLAKMKKEHGPIIINGVQFSGSQYFELAQLIAKGMTPQDMLYPIIKDVTNHWFYGTIDFMGTKGKVSHGAYRRARIVEKRIKYSSDAVKEKENSGESQYDDIIFDDIQDIIDRGITQEDIDKYENGKVKDAIDKYNKIYNDNLDNPGNTGAEIEDKNSLKKNKEAHEHTLEYLKKMYQKQTEGESTEKKSGEADEKTPLQSEFEIYLDTKMQSTDDDRGIFYQASEPELLGPSKYIKKVFSKSYYQYDGTSDTAKKIAAAKAIDDGSDTYYYSGEEYQIQQSDLEEKNEATKARKEGDLENEYYSSPMAKKKLSFTKNNKKAALQALAMLDSMKTQAGDEAYKNIKELLYSLEYFTEEELTTKTKNVLLWIADNGEKTGHENWQTENTKTNSKAERDDNSKYNLVVKNLKQKNMNIVAPGDATASYTSEDGGILTLSFTEMSQDTYDILNYKFNGLKDVKDKSYTGSFTKIDKNILTGYTMKIKGIKDPGKTEFKRGETIVEVENGMTDFGNEDNGKIEISLINEEGSPHDSIEEYMKSDYTKTDEENLKKQMEIEKQSLLRAGYVYTGSASTMTSDTSLATGGNSEGIDFGAGNYTEFNMSNAQEKSLNHEQMAFIIYTHLTERGFTPNQAAGVVGNAMVESIDDNHVWIHDSNMGLFQHNGDEEEKLTKFLKARNKDFATQSLIEDQVDFMISIIKPSSGRSNLTGQASSNMKGLGYATVENRRKEDTDAEVEYLRGIQHITSFADQEKLYGEWEGYCDEGGKYTPDTMNNTLYQEFKGYETPQTTFYDMFFNSPSPETAATAFCRGYERPESRNAVKNDDLPPNKPFIPQARTDKRRNYARKYFNKFTNQAEIDRIKASLPKQPTTHDSRAFVARTVQGGTVAEDSGSAANTAALANGTEIGLDSNWKYANFSKINSGKAKFYKSTAANKKGKVITVNAGHGTSGGSSQKTQAHPDGTVKITDATNKAGEKYSIAISEGMTFEDKTTEAAINLKVALKLRDKLLAKGYDVVMIRETSDVQLDNIARTVIANNNSDAHIAIHYDSTTSDKGAFYMKVTDDRDYKKMDPVSRMWQQHDRLGESLLNGLQEKGRKIWTPRGQDSDLTQTSYSTIPSVDIELGDKKTPHDDATNDKMAEGLAAGVDKFFNK